MRNWGTLTTLIAGLLAATGASITTFTELPWRGLLGWTMLLAGVMTLLVSTTQNHSARHRSPAMAQAPAPGRAGISPSILRRPQ